MAQQLQLQLEQQYVVIIFYITADQSVREVLANKIVSEANEKDSNDNSVVGLLGEVTEANGGKILKGTCYAHPARLAAFTIFLHTLLGNGADSLLVEDKPGMTNLVSGAYGRDGYGGSFVLTRLGEDNGNGNGNEGKQAD